MKDLHLFLAIECGHDLPQVENSFCQVDFTETPQIPAHKAGHSSFHDFKRADRKRTSCCGRGEASIPVMTSKMPLGRTRTESGRPVSNPYWLWNMTSAHRVAGIGKRGWIVIQVLEEEPEEEGTVVDDNYTVIRGVVGEIQINLDEITRDNLIENWYSVGPGEDTIDGFCVGDQLGRQRRPCEYINVGHVNVCSRLCQYREQ